MASFDSYKKSRYHSIKHSTYFAVYDKLFAPFVGKKITFVEIGVFHGGSLFMWRDFFGKKARIIGVDLNPEAKKFERAGFEIFIGSQSDPKFWKRFYKKVGPIDILLDDGGHTFEQQIVTTTQAIPNTKDGGMIVVEDTHTSYMDEFGGPAQTSFMSFAKNLVDGINYRFGDFRDERAFEKSVYSARFFESIVALEIDRKLCAKISAPTSNNGKVTEAIDFRNSDPISMTPKKVAKLFKY